MRTRGRARAIGFARLVCAKIVGRVMVASDPTDISLLQRIVARDTAALAELYDRHSRLLFGLILRIVRDRGEAEEILQEAFVRVWSRAERYDPRVGGPLPWMVRVARNCAIDRLRAQRTRATVNTPARDWPRSRPQRPPQTSSRQRQPYWMLRAGGWLRGRWPASRPNSGGSSRRLFSRDILTLKSRNASDCRWEP